MRLVLFPLLLLFELASSGAAHAADAATLARGKLLMEGIVACGNCQMAAGPQGEPLKPLPIAGQS
jgi:hypothetical protein